MKQPIQWLISPLKMMILDAIFRQIGAENDTTAQMAFFAMVSNSTLPTAECFPTTSEEWKELAVLAQEGPPRTDCYYAYAAAMVEFQKERRMAA
jgi:hypothetical protein